MHERKLTGVQKHPLHPLLRDHAIELEVTVFVVADDRMSEVGQLNADLMGATGLEFSLDKTELVESAQAG